MNDRDQALNRIAALAVAIVDHVDETIAQQHPRPGSEIETLISVRHCNTFTVGWLSGVLKLSHSAAVRIADRLGEEGLLVRTVLDNRRYVGLQLTRKGAAVADELLASRRRALEALFRGVADEQLRGCGDVADRLLAAMTADELSGYRICRACDEAMCGADCPVDRALDSAVSAGGSAPV